MKNIKKIAFVVIIVFILCINLNAQTDILPVKKGDIIPAEGYWISKNAADIMLRNGKLVQDMSADIVSLKIQLNKANEISLEKDYTISRLNMQIASYMAMEKVYKDYIKDMDKIVIQNRVLIILGGIGWGLAGGSLIGIASYAALHGTGAIK